MQIPAGFTPGSIAQFDDFIAQNMRDSTEADADQSDLDTALGKPRVMTTAMMKAMLEETEHNAKIRIAQQEAEEKRKLARTELELKADTQVQMMANEKYKRVSRELELSPRSPNLYAVQNLNQSTTSQ
jgi:geranylgeranyl pyrophosphate synthase